MQKPVKQSKELDTLKQTLASVEEKYNKAKADMGETPDGNDPEGAMEDMQDMCDQLMSMCKNLGNYCDYLSNRMYDIQDQQYAYASDHQNGHLPKIMGADKMNTALKKLGLDGDYQVAKKTICASEIKGNTLEISITKEK